MDAPPFESDTSITRILVVDYMPDNYVLLRAVLKLQGYQVEVANNGYTALEMIEVNPPDLILLNVFMPAMNGFEVTQCIRHNSRLPFIPILLFTADREIEESLAFSTGANGILYKPFTPNLLLEQVRTILSKINRA